MVTNMTATQAVKRERNGYLFSAFCLFAILVLSAIGVPYLLNATVGLIGGASLWSGLAAHGRYRRNVMVDGLALRRVE